jgi:single-strand DNA-binding protein
MANMVILVGRLGADPQVQQTQGGRTVARFSLATNERFQDKDGKVQERVDWHRVVAWGKQAENCGQYLKKGRLVSVEGRLQTRSFEDKEGVTRWVTEVVARRVEFLDGNGNGKGRSVPPPTDEDAPAWVTGGKDGASAAGKEAPPEDDDIPF